MNVTQRDIDNIHRALSHWGGGALLPAFREISQVFEDVRKLDEFVAPALELSWESSGSVCRLLCGDGEAGVVAEFVGDGDPDRARRRAVEAIERGDV
jgi:hypothetical protein